MFLNNKQGGKQKVKDVQQQEHAWQLNGHVVRDSLMFRISLICPNSLSSIKPSEWYLPKINSFMIYSLAVFEQRCTSKQPDIQLSALLPCMNAISPVSLLKRDMGHLSSSLPPHPGQ